MAHVGSSSTAVEQERLVALVGVHRQHIAELQQQLKEALEFKKQQQLQLVQASPARSGVRKLLSQAAADNQALAMRCEELRGQRNALAVTKAALTAQVSELMRMVVDERQLEAQHKKLQQQLQQLCRLAGQHTLDQPGEQLAALAAFIKQAQQHQQLAVPPPAPAAAAAPPSSPTGVRLDQRATSELIWSNGSCPQLFPKQQQSQAQTPSFGTWLGGNAAGGAAVTRTAASCLSDLASLSPLRTSTGAAAVTGEEPTPCSRTPAASAALAAATGGSPLSAQSLSDFIDSHASPAQRSSHRGLSLLSPLRRRGLAAVAAAAAAAGSQASSGDASHGQPQPGKSAVDARQLDGAGSRDQQLLVPGCSPATPASIMGCSTGAAAAAAGVCSPSSSRQPASAAKQRATPGLDLGPAFRLAAVDSLWHSPAAAAIKGGLSLHDAAAPPAAGSAVMESHRWHNWHAPDSPAGLCRALDFHADGWDPAAEEHGAEGQHGRQQRWRRLVVPLLAVAAASGAAVWQLRRQSEAARALMRSLQGHLAHRAQQGLSGACGHMRRTLQQQRRRQAGQQPAGQPRLDAAS